MDASVHRTAQIAKVARFYFVNKAERFSTSWFSSSSSSSYSFSLQFWKQCRLQSCKHVQCERSGLIRTSGCIVYEDKS